MAARRWQGRALGGQGELAEGPLRATSVAKAAAESFNVALDAFAATTRPTTGTKRTCKSVAEMFLDAPTNRSPSAATTFAEALYNAGLAYQRCKQRREGEGAVRGGALGGPEVPPRARAARALRVQADRRTMDAAIGELDAGHSRRAVPERRGARQPRHAPDEARRETRAGRAATNDLECAKKNLQRALAIDDGFMPAFNQLALYYLELARRSARARPRCAVSASAVRGVRPQKGQVDSQQLELAALVCSQAIRKNPNYAPIHNTAGLIQVELGNFNGAVGSSTTARKLDPKFFEAQMNYAAVNLSFRGFEQAEEAYRAALAMRPNDYDAHLGLALALRGQINDSNFDKIRRGSRTGELDAAKKIDANRAETYYNEAILTQEYKAKTGGDPVPAYQKAIGQYEAFIPKAGSAESFAGGEALEGACSGHRRHHHLHHGRSRDREGPEGSRRASEGRRRSGKEG